MFFEQHPLLLQRLSQERLLDLRREAEQRRLLRQRVQQSYHVDRFAFRLGGLLCSLGARLQNRQVL